MSRGRYDGTPGLQTIAEMRFAHYGVLQDPYLVQGVVIRDRKGDVLSDPTTWSYVKAADGIYTLTWNVPPMLGGTFRDEWTVWLTEADWNLDHPVGGPATELHTSTFHGSLAVGLPPAWTITPTEAPPPGIVSRFNAQPGCVVQLSCVFCDRSGYPVDPAVMEPVEVFVRGVSVGFLNPVRDTRGIYSVLYAVPSNVAAGECQDVWRWKWTSADPNVQTRTNVFQLYDVGYYATVALDEINLTYRPSKERFPQGTIEYLTIDVLEKDRKLHRIPEGSVRAWQLMQDGTERSVVLSTETPRFKDMTLYQLVDTTTLQPGLYAYQITIPWGRETIRSPRLHFRVVMD